MKLSLSDIAVVLLDGMKLSLSDIAVVLLDDLESVPVYGETGCGGSLYRRLDEVGGGGSGVCEDPQQFLMFVERHIFTAPSYCVILIVSAKDLVIVGAGNWNIIFFFGNLIVEISIIRSGVFRPNFGFHCFDRFEGKPLDHLRGQFGVLTSSGHLLEGPRNAVAAFF